MNKVMLVGKTGCGKTTLIQSFQEQKIVYKKTQAITFSGIFIDSPGEFLENRRLYPALLTTSVGCNIVALVQDATLINSVYPPNFSSMFKKRILGIVTKVDKESSNPERAEKFLRRAGAEEIIMTSAIDKTGLQLLRESLTKVDMDDI
ncbi:ethanolamine utilization protein EutP [Desulfuromusa kysingii]|uniref:Ethanolamine utilization protein EutP n=1 Tax=Desulfuromusa kysingii TaxID=37625 RepID=A0A1H3ZYT8_9BACT|nr:EutP/PduV family microcompartment system protein [Desulfuromusa kysingii]SEA28807.1 ethanolamine utilization protein EutP [Desulfuromusa kysingii]